MRRKIKDIKAKTRSDQANGFSVKIIQKSRQEKQMKHNGYITQQEVQKKGRVTLEIDANLPTKTDLISGALVDFTSKHKSVATNTLKLAESLGIKHSNVTRVVKRLLKNSNISRLNIEPSNYLNERGKSYRYYQLEEAPALQVIMGLSGSKAEGLQKEIAHAFVEMKVELQHWHQQAHITTDSTKQANDRVYWLQQELVKVIPESKRCTMLFIHIQNWITKAATGSAKTKREEMTTEQLGRIELLERKVDAEIERLRAKNILAEEIREEIKIMLKNEASNASPENGEFQYAA